MNVCMSGHRVNAIRLSTSAARSQHLPWLGIIASYAPTADALITLSLSGRFFEREIGSDLSVVGVCRQVQPHRRVRRGGHDLRQSRPVATAKQLIQPERGVVPLKLLIQAAF